MKKILLASSCAALALGSVNAQTQGPSSSQTPYLVPVANDVKITSILTVGDEVNGYKMAGIPDGMGAFDNGDGTFTLVMNHEHGNTSGNIRAHGSKGSFVSKWIIETKTLKVLNGSDLMQRVKLWEGGQYNTYYSSNPSANAAFSRFCSADLPAVSAYYNEATGKGTKERIFMDGEESGTEGRPMGHIVTGPEAGTSYELTYLGRMAYENVIASPYEQDKTIVALTDDGSGGQVYFYIGEKKSVGNTIEKAGLTGGKVYGLAITGTTTESNTAPPAAGTAFTLVDMGSTLNVSGSTLNTNSINQGVTTFMRPEDGAWDPKNPNVFYFVTTNGFGTSNPSRLWQVTFSDIKNPELGGTITAVLDGTEGQEMMDNLTIDHFGHVLIVEDPGGNPYNALVRQYDIATDALTVIAKHDPDRFEIGGSSFLTTNEECSGIFDAQHILGAGWFIAVDQAHYGQPGELVEGGQLLAIFNPDSYNANPEISIEGNNTDIPAGANSPKSGDNTDFGNTATGTSVTKTFVVKNAGPADLTVTGVNISGANAAQFALDGATFPMTIAAGSTQSIKVKFTPTNVGLHKANLEVKSNDFDESAFNFAVQGVGLNPADVANTSLEQFVKLFPNPTRDMATVAISLNEPKTVSVTVVNMNGKLVAAPIQEQLPSGEQKINVNTSNLPNGNYFVVISAGEEITKVQLVVAH